MPFAQECPSLRSSKYTEEPPGFEGKFLDKRPWVCLLQERDGRTPIMKRQRLQVNHYFMRRTIIRFVGISRLHVRVVGAESDHVGWIV